MVVRINKNKNLNFSFGNIMNTLKIYINYVMTDIAKF